jgi:hypothetical protein
LGKRQIVHGNTTPEGRSVLTQFRVFPISTSVDITVYQHGKNVLYLFYNIAQRNIKKEIFRRFCVDSLSHINTALSQSTFRIYKCYIINSIVNQGYFTVARKYDFYFRVVKTIFYERAQRVSKTLFSTREIKVIFPKPP